MMIETSNSKDAATSLSCSEEGFTIIEMLVGLCIAALMTALMATTLGQLRPLRDRTERIEIDTELAAAGAYLENLISNARDITLLNSDSNNRIVFSGSPRSIRFAASVRTGSDRRSLREVELFADANGDGFKLRQTNNIRRVFTRPPGETFTVLAGLKAVRFQFLAPSMLPGSDRWRDEWSAERLLPGAVKISIEALRSGRVIKLERVVPVSASHARQG